MCTHRNRPNLLKPWWFGTAAMTKVRFLANSLLKGHQRSLEAFVNNSWLKRDRTLEITSLCLSQNVGDSFIVFVSSRRIGWYATWPISIITWPWPEVKFWPWPFKVKSYIIRIVSTRETRWCHCRLFIFISSNVIHERIFRPSQLFLQYLTYGGLTVDLRSLLRKTLSKEELKSYRLVSFAFF